MSEPPIPHLGRVHTNVFADVRELWIFISSHVVCRPARIASAAVDTAPPPFRCCDDDWMLVCEFFDVIGTEIQFGPIFGFSGPVVQWIRITSIVVDRQPGPSSASVVGRIGPRSGDLNFWTGFLKSKRWRPLCQWCTAGCGLADDLGRDEPLGICVALCLMDLVLIYP